ncbi:MAG: hypothetical protein JNL28_08570 [Planctomycetes bacterium]|nr:hypothetical protein [Planctomycetota bacterium]
MKPKARSQVLALLVALALIATVALWLGQNRVNLAVDSPASGHPRADVNSPEVQQAKLSPLLAPDSALEDEQRSPGIDTIVQASATPERPQEPFELDGRLRNAKACLRERFYNPTGASLSKKQVDELQALIDSLNAALARTVAQTDEALKAKIEDKFATGDVRPSTEPVSAPDGGKILFQTERVKIGPEGSSATVAVILLGDDAAIDAMVHSAHIQLGQSQDTVRAAIAEMIR